MEKRHLLGIFPGAGKLSMQTALRLDRYVEIAEQNDIAIQLTLQHHGQFSTTVNPDWNDNPYNIAAGGFLSNPAEFFTDAECPKVNQKQVSLHRCPMGIFTRNLRLGAFQRSAVYQRLGQQPGKRCQLAQ